MDTKTFVKARRKILSKIIKTPESCWLWTGATKLGYGRLSIAGREIGAHRLSFIVFRNRLDLLQDLQLFVCHTCDNKHCVNPEHLFVGDWLENAMDDVLRNPNVGKEFMKSIEQKYRERYNLRPCVRIRRLLLTKKPKPPTLEL